MKSVPTTYRNLLLEDVPTPNLVLVSRQIDGLREVLKRMNAAKSTVLESLVNEKLEEQTRR